MTSLLNIAGNIPVVEAGGQSLRFEDGDSAYLSWTPASAGNQKTWTWSGWFKTTTNAVDNTFIDAFVDANNECVFRTNSNQLSFIMWDSGAYKVVATTAAVFRDPSAWYHIVLAVDTTQATNTDGVKIWVNGVQQTLSFYTYTQNNDGRVNATVTHRIGLSAISGSNRYTDGYLANVCFIDGTALDPTSFGEYDGTLWKPKSDADIQSLTFGTNGFYLPFKQTTEAEGFSTVTYTGSGAVQSIEGVGFEPDFVWIKKRDTSSQHTLVDSIRGVGNWLESDTTAAEQTGGAPTSLDASGFTLSSWGQVNASGSKYVAWCWDAGSGSAVSNTDGSITSSVKANTAKGFSVVSYTGNTTAGATVGHGLSSAPDLIIVKNRDTARNWTVYNSASGATKYLLLNTTNADQTATSVWNDTAPTSSVFSVGTSQNINYAENYIAYCFHSVSGYSSIGSYTGTGASGNTVTLGFEPAFVMIKRSDAAGDDWVMVDTTRSPVNPRDDHLTANSSAAETSGGNRGFDTSATGFTINHTGAAYNTSGGTYIYMAFADTRDATFFGDTSGNSNNWTPNALNNTDVVPDSPVSGGNFAVLNPLVNVTGGSFSEGNLKVTTGSSAYGPAISSFAVSSGKWYCEFLTTASSGDQRVGGVRVSTNLTTTYDLGNSGSFAYRQNDGQKKIDGTQTAYGATWAADDIIGMALNLDDDEVTFYKNNSSQGTFSITTGEYFLATSDGDSGAGMGAFANFGQDSSFAGNETPQGNTDDNGVGDFYYAPPSGYLALTTGNLPAATITAPDDYFNTSLWTATGTQSITGVGFQPDWLWVKVRSTAASHYLMDSVRGASEYLQSDTTDAEDTASTFLTSFDSDGYSFGSGNWSDSRTVVGWSWLAGGTAVSNTDGSITSTVSANQTAGFSIVSYTGTGALGTVGHGLSSTPEFIVFKRRDSTSNWISYNSTSGSSNALYLDLTNANTATTYMNSTDPTASVFTVNTNTDSNASGGTYIAYCFHSVEGYSKIGSYTGNGSTDGTFVHCGFRPAWVIVKKTDSVGHWNIIDIARDTYNVADAPIIANLSNAESTYTFMDVLSNGFKLRNTGGGLNASGGSYIFLAFAEAPFKSANAR